MGREFSDFSNAENVPSMQVDGLGIVLESYTEMMTTLEWKICSIVDRKLDVFTSHLKYCLSFLRLC